MAKPFTDEELVGYFEIHSKTDLALFHWTHIRDLLTLIEEPLPEGLSQREFWPFHWLDHKRFIRAARKRLSAKDDNTA